jgi:L-rhamnose mutarotase
MPENRICLALDLKDDPDSIQEYEKHHQEVWPEVIASIKNAGITNMEIFRTGNRLVMIMTVDDSFDAEKKAKADTANPRVQQWEQLMDTYQQKLPWAPAEMKWVPMDKIFQLHGVHETITQNSAPINP